MCGQAINLDFHSKNNSIYHLKDEFLNYSLNCMSSTINHLLGWVLKYHSNQSQHFLLANLVTPFLPPKVTLNFQIHTT